MNILTDGRPRGRVEVPQQILHERQRRLPVPVPPPVLRLERGLYVLIRVYIHIPRLLSPCFESLPKTIHTYTYMKKRAHLLWMHPQHQPRLVPPRRHPGLPRVQQHADRPMWRRDQRSLHPRAAQKLGEPVVLYYTWCLVWVRSSRPNRLVRVSDRLTARGTPGPCAGAVGARPTQALLPPLAGERAGVPVERYRHSPHCRRR